jgi:hypothetical protein
MMTKCAFAEGDRVEHKLFGIGTVMDAPVAAVGAALHAPRRVKQAGWRMVVRWDDASRDACTVMDFALRKVASPESRPFSHYERHWNPLREEWLETRRRVEGLLSRFRPPCDPVALTDALEAEARALAALTRFVRDESDGKHP